MEGRAGRGRRGRLLTSAVDPEGGPASSRARLAPRPNAAAHDAGMATVALGALVLLLPFEPRAALRLGGLSFTLLEAAAAAAAVALAWAGRRRLIPLARQPPLPLAALGAYALAHLLSAVLAPQENARAGRFALRMAAMAAFGILVAAAPRGARRKGLLALVVAAMVVAALAWGEGLGLRRLDGLLARFRETPFNVAGLRRATAGSEYPNQAAAFLMCGLVAGAGLLAPRPRSLALIVPGSIALVGALLFTYSRGALVATGLGLLAQAAFVRRRDARWPAAPLVALGVLVVGSSLFASTEEVFRLRLGRAGGDDWYRATYEPSETSLTLRPGETRSTTVKVTNTGPKTWTEREAFHLSYHWFSPDRRSMEDGGRTRLGRDLGRGESAVLEARITAPRNEGRYLLVWDMVHEHTAWFSGQGVRVAVVPTRVGLAGADSDVPLDPGPIAPTLAWRPTRGELWRLAVGMWAERPWAGFGSDSFRWSYGPRAGHGYWDVRIFANNTLLEAAATTGTPGAATLLLTLLASAVAAARAGSGPGAHHATGGAALFGLVIALLAHGVVDYVLAFTGHYLLLAFVVGSCAALPGDLA